MIRLNDLSWVKYFIYGGSIVVNVNNDIGTYFHMRKCLRQDDPLPPIMFNMVAHMLAILINTAKIDDQVTGVVPHLVRGGLFILQYDDDTIFFMDHDLEKASNMKLILCAFEQLSGHKINFHKREIFCFWEAHDQRASDIELLGCNLGTLPMRYLDLPIHYRKLSNIV